MRCIEILQTATQKNLQNVHRRRQHAVWRAVAGAIQGRQLCLTSLGRALPGSTTDKHRIKAVDRLLGNRALHRELETFYRALAAWLLKRVKTPIIAVDWTGAGAHHYELSAKLCSDGRALPLYSLVFPKNDYGTVRAHRRFLLGLASIVPRDCTPILVTDAGFHYNWFDEVTWLGWHYIGRVRGRSQVYVNGAWRPIQTLYQRARRKPQNLGRLMVPRRKPQVRRLVLSQLPKLKGRKRLTHRGTPGRRATDIKAAKAAREPWLLATSLESNPKFVVRAYSLRMQIEETFRDQKSYRNGLSMHLATTRSCERMAVLILIASLAKIVVQLVGRAVAGTRVARQFQANTVRHRRVFSFFFLGCRALQQHWAPTDARLRAAIHECLATLQTNAQDFATG